MSPLAADEMAALMKGGMSPARAMRTVEVQNEVARTDIVSKVEAAMGSAYAGVWFEPATGRLQFGVTSPMNSWKVGMVVAQEGLAADVTETPVRSTWTQLETAQKAWNRRLAGLFARDEVKTALTAQRNAVSVFLSSSVSAPERTVLEHRASTGHVNVFVSVVRRPRFRLVPAINKTKCNKWAENEARCDKPITPGVTIETKVKKNDEDENEWATCTAGPLTIPEGNKYETYLLTAGHCIDDAEKEGYGKSWFARNRAGEKKEIGVAGEFKNNAEGDVGVIEVANPGEWTEAGLDPVFAVVARWSVAGEPIESVPVVGWTTPVENLPNCKEGSRTSETCGTIKDTNVTLEGHEHLVEDKGADVNKGDSGGPWFSTDAETSGLLEGTTVGWTEAEPEDDGVYEPLKRTFEILHLSLELLTTSNEVRPTPCGG